MSEILLKCFYFKMVGCSKHFAIIVVALLATCSVIETEFIHLISDPLTINKEKIIPVDRSKLGWISKALIPIYLQHFLTHFKANESDWHLGVESQKCIEDVRIWLTKLTDKKEIEKLSSDENKWVLQSNITCLNE